MEPPRTVRLNGKEYALIRASDADGKEHQFLLSSDVSVDSVGRFVPVSNPLMTSAISQPHTPGHDRATAVSCASSASSVSAAGHTWSHDLSNWTPKLGTDLDSKWLQRIETDLMATRPTLQPETSSSHQELNLARFPIFTKADNIVSKPRPIPVLLKPVVQSEAVVTTSPVAKEQHGTSNSLVLLSTGKGDGAMFNWQVAPKPMSMVVNSEESIVVSNTGNIGSGPAVQKMINLPKTMPNTRAQTPVYKSKLEKAIAQNNMNMANSQNTTVSTEQSQNQGTLKRLLNSKEYHPPMLFVSGNNPNLQGPATEEHITMETEADLSTHKEAETSPIASGTSKKKSVKRKSADQNMTTASGELYKKIVKSERTPPADVSNSGNPMMFAIPAAALENMLLTKSAAESTNTASQTAMPPPLTLMAQCKTNTTKVSAADTSGRKTLKSKLSDKLTARKSVEEMEYVDNSLARDILQCMWDLREQELLCDAVVCTGDRQVKLHKVVLAGVSAEMNLKVTQSREAELRLMVPADITFDNLMLFVSYLYHGTIKLTVENVQQLYRLSGVFNQDHLKKHCYEFCRVSKMGHLIISSPYHEAAKRIVEPSKPAFKKRKSQALVKEKQMSQAAKQPTTDSDDKAASAPPVAISEEKANDFVWMTPDPSQSNMPIRKRGRTRAGITVTTSSSATEVSSNSVTATQVIPQKESPEVVEPEIRPVSDCAADVETSPPKQVKPMVASLSKLPKKKAIVREAINVKESEPVEEVIQPSNDLPDPLATGKFDESELLKIVPLEFEMLVVDPDPVQPKEKTSPAKTMMTRLRNRPKTMSVMEAASQKKAKSNDTSSIYATKSPPKTKDKRNKKAIANTGVKSSKATDKSKSEEAISADNSDSEKIERQKKTNKKLSLGHENVANPTPSDSEVNASVNLEQKDRNKKEHMKEDLSNSLANKDNSIIRPASSSNTSDNSFDQAKTQTVSDEIDKTTQAEMSLKRKTSDAGNSPTITTEVSTDQAVTDADFQDTVSVPKKAKQRKSGVEPQQESPKDTVYMRPPPKKRTKEIREMMKYEEDVEEVKAPPEPEKQLPPEPTMKEVFDSLEKDVKNTFSEDKKVISKKVKKKAVKDSVMMQQVFDIELSGKGIEGEKQFRCTLCNNVFIFARRVVNHLVNTHEVQIEEAKDNVSVEPKSACPKICDVCGYQPKEVNIYYIHFHKYFRHGVPLPKGWQPFTCDLCKKEFFTKFQLREHKLIHFEDNPFVCEVCGSGFKSRTCLNSHVFHKHSSVRKYVCRECPKTFKTRTQLKVHERIHTGDKPFACPDDQCTYRSTTRGNMRLHLVNRHKFSNDHIKDIMNALQPSETPPAQQESDMQEASWAEHVAVAERDLNEERAVAMASDPATLTTLVEAAVAEVNSAGGYHVTALNEHNQGQDGTIVHVLSNDDQMASHLMDQDQTVNHTEREYDMSLVHPVQLVSNVSMMGHSEQDETYADHMPMMVQAEIDIQQNSDMLMRHQDQSSGTLHDYHQNTGQHTVQLIPLQEYREQDLPPNSQAFSITQDQGLELMHQMPHRPSIDPGSREARMIVKEVFQGHEPRSLLKAAILQGTIDSSELLQGTRESAKLTLDTRSFVDAHPAHSSDQFPEEGALVIDTHPDTRLVIADDSVVHNVRIDEQFRGGHSNTMFRTGGHDPSQHQTLDLTHMQISSYQQTSMAPPPSYSGPSHGMMTAIPVSNISVSHGLDQGQGQFQSETVQTMTIQQAPCYSEGSSQQQTSPQLNPDGTTYGYYQQNFPIENY